MKHYHSSWLTELSSVYTHSQLGLLQHGGCFIDKESFKASMDECSELFFQTSSVKSLFFTDYEIITKTIIPLEALLQLRWQIL
jgi:hypothetical protein